MMPPPIPPMPPMPPRIVFDSDMAYEAALKRHKEHARIRDDMVKDQMATMILFALLLMGATIGSAVFLLYVAGGIKAILYGLCAAGLLWVAHVQIRRRL